MNMPKEGLNPKKEDELLWKEAKNDPVLFDLLRDRKLINEYRAELAAEGEKPTSPEFVESARQLQLLDEDIMRREEYLESGGVI